MMVWEKIWIPSLVFGFLLLIRLRRKKPNLSWLQGRCALITGAGSGLGLSLAMLLNRLGAKVILCGRNVDRLKEAQNSLPRREVQSWIFQMDLSKLDAIDDLAKQIAAEIDTPVHILINNAGQSYRGVAERTSLIVHNQLMTVNYLGQVAVTLAWLEHLRRKNGEARSNEYSDWTVYISSIQGRFALPFRSGYSAPKHALQAFADSFRAEQAATKDGVRVLVASPGYIQTNLSLNAIRDSGEKHGEMDKTTASGMKPDKVAELIINAMGDGRDEITVAPTLHKLVIILRAVFPSLYFWVMKSRAKRDNPY